MAAACVALDWPERAQQSTQLRTLFSCRSPGVAGVHVFGPRSSGKTSVVLASLQAAGAAFAYVNCSEIVTDRDAFACILDQLAEHDARARPAKAELADAGTPHRPAQPRKVDDVAWHDRRSDFAHKLLGLHALADRVVYVVLDQPLRINSRYPSFLPALFGLGEATCRQVCLVLITKGFEADADLLAGRRVLVPVHFPAYSEQELVAVLTREVPPSAVEALPAEDVPPLLAFVVSLAHHATRDPRELLFCVSQLVPQFAELMGPPTHLSLKQCCQRLRPACVALVKDAFRHERGTFPADVAPDKALELPRVLKFLIMAAFLASFNPPQQDRNMFSVVSDAVGRRRGGKRKRGSGAPLPLLLGPKPFPLDRMLAIFRTICPDADTSRLLVQVTTLVSFGVLLRPSAAAREELLDDTRLVCNWTYERALALANSAGFELNRFLYQPS